MKHGHLQNNNLFNHDNRTYDRDYNHWTFELRYYVYDSNIDYNKSKLRYQEILTYTNICNNIDIHTFLDEY